MSLAPPPDRHVVLVVDDEPTAIRMVTATLAAAGFRTVTAGNGADGLECFGKFKDEICLVITDVVMPILNGVEMAEQIMQIARGTKILLMSGFSDAVLQMHGATRGLPLIRKPFSGAELIQKVESVMGQASAAGGA